MHISKEGLRDTAWRLRCSILRTTDERTLSDYSSGSGSSDVDDVGEAPKTKGKSSLLASSAKDGKDAFGSSVTVKTLYEGSNLSEGFYNWIDYPPRQLSKTATKNQDKVAIRLYKIKDKSKPVLAGRFALRYHKIEIQNMALISAIAPILEAKEDQYLTENETAGFLYPFRPLYFCYDDFVAKLRGLNPSESPEDALLQPYLKLFVCALDDLFAEVRSKRRALAGRGLANFEHAWTHFPRGSIVRSHGGDGDVLSRVLDTEYVKPMLGGDGAQFLGVTCQILRFNGEAFVWERQQLKIEQFDGNRPIVDFEHCPTQSLPAAEQAELKKRLAARGRLMLDYQGLAYRHYTGVGRTMNAMGKVEKHNVDCRVLIDVVGFNKHHLAQGVREGKSAKEIKKVVPGTGRQMDKERALQEAKARTDTALLESGGRPLPDATLEDLQNGHAMHPRNHSRKKTAAHMHAPASAAKAKADAGQLLRLNEQEQAHNTSVMLGLGEDLMFMTPMVEGYALKNKEWFSFCVEDLRPIQWNDQAYDHLVYDEQQKDLVLSFVESHGHSPSKMDDVIIGKGDGLIILLSGPPGTGKTLTAEAVADRTHRPLFYLQAEDLGINAAQLGANIKKVFEMATEWDAVILLDEADVFMAERHPQDIARNELVSIFLRELEYFRGIIFLTTNLYDTIDTAFRSRVSLHLLFRPLTIEARLSVWRKFLARVTGPELKERALLGGEDGAAGSSGIVDVTYAESDYGADDETGPANTISDEDLGELSAWILNGREIKTAVKMVTTWCAHKGHAMTLERLENGIRVTSPHATKMDHKSTDLYDE
ncbi:aaa family ATPase [Ophiostoma piceae UAMH 11346]|uniref:Aaa family ATPase n=1 Tax=Ophiostoma piceae (strain UAMH 11346) TaxID=1262450 RepID=S3D1V1_OPHP1|nr:aaa family ATPase [Ophiostoma piceae UAMH 11346]